MDLLLYKVVIIFRNPYSISFRFSEDEYIISIFQTINLEFSGDLKYLALLPSHPNS